MCGKYHKTRSHSKLPWNQFFFSNFFLRRTLIWRKKYWLFLSFSFLNLTWNDFSTVWKLWNFSATILLQKFRQTNCFTKEFCSKLIWRKKFYVAVNFSFFHAVFSKPSKLKHCLLTFHFFREIILSTRDVSPTLALLSSIVRFLFSSNCLTKDTKFEQYDVKCSSSTIVVPRHAINVKTSFCLL